MKKLLFTLSLAAAIFSCKDENDLQPQKGSLSFGFEQKSNSGGREGEDNTPSSILTSVQKANGTYLFEDKSLPLFNFGPSFTSESIEFEVGDYKLTKLWVLNAKGDVIGVTPVIGSPNASKVSTPLPISFKISANQSTQLACEVIKVQQDAAAYGYGGFGIKFVQQPNPIKINFVASTNPNMQTHGYDSVIVTLTNGTTVLRKKLNVISPVQAVGTVMDNELVGNGVCGTCWTATVSAYYESIDEVLYNLHINEALTNTSFTLNANTNEIKFEGGKLRLLANSTEYLSQNIVWENWAHLYDNTGFFEFIVKNDICNSSFEVKILKTGVDYVYYDKDIWSTNLGDYDFKSYGLRNHELYNVGVGSYLDQTTFKDFCPDLTGRKVYGEILFYLNEPIAYHTCYLVWMYENTPIDPDGAASPKFKVMVENGKAPGSGRLWSKK